MANNNYYIDWQSTVNAVSEVTGKNRIVLPQKTTNTSSTSITLTGKGLPNYGEIQQENFLKLLENFASSAVPLNPTIGQIWFNTEENIAYIYTDFDISPALQRRKYLGGSDGLGWAQLWPTPVIFAGLTEYNALASRMRLIMGTPTIINGQAYGWGVEDASLPPILEYATFDNASWINLLDKLSACLEYVGQSSNAALLISPVGFIDDGRPGGSSGWGGAGIVTLQMYFNNTINALNILNDNRFQSGSTNSIQSIMAAHTRISPWGTE